MTDRMVRDDIGSIRASLERGDVTFLDSVLRGSGWMPYDQLADKKLQQEYKSRELDINENESSYDARFGKERNQ